MTLILAGLATLSIVVAWKMGFSTDPIIQPIAYNHNLHVEQEGLGCLDCHALAEEMASATIPPLAVCQDCHDEEPMSESAEELHLIEYLETGTEIPWNRIYEVPDHVYFSHRRHVVLGEIQCSECHGRVADQTAPPESPLMELSMDWCMDCHRGRQVSNDCLACHR
jgi:hypothetical protein